MGRITLGELLNDFTNEQEFYIYLDDEHGYEWMSSGDEFTINTVPDEFLRMDVIDISENYDMPNYKFITIENNTQADADDLDADDFRTSLNPFNVRRFV